jgi:pectin methylesterase-like acyl-CoA thioesterase
MATKGHPATRYVGTNAERIAQNTSILTIGTTWIETDGNFAAYAWNGSIWVRTQDTYQQTVTVAKSGGDFTTIQGAIDSITDATTNKRYCVLVYPGDYAETIVGKSYVELMGLAAREAVNITGATGPLYTFPDDEGHIFNMKFSLSPTTADQVAISIPATVNARQIINNCLFAWSSASDINGYVFLIAGGEAEISYSKIIYTHTGNNAGIKVHRIVAVSGDAIVDLFDNIVDVNIDDIDDTVNFFQDASLTGGDIHIVQNVVNMTSNNAGAYSGIMRAVIMTATVGHVTLHSNYIDLQSLEAGGTGRGEYVRLNTAAGGGIIDSTANHVHIEGFATNYWANVAAGDDIVSHFDDIAAVDGVTGAGTATYVNSLVDGAISLTGSISAIPDEITATDAGVAASVLTLNTEVTTNGDADLDNVTLANGISGQVKRIYCVVEGNAGDTWKITPANMIGGTQITFAGAGEGCTLVYADNEGWCVTANNGGTIT